jgi:hypothetical protein
MTDSVRPILSSFSLCAGGCGRFADSFSIDSRRCFFCARQTMAHGLTIERLRSLSKRYNTPMYQLNEWWKVGCGIMGCEGRRLHVDHNHDCCPTVPTCGECTRGILCARHNQGLEAFFDSAGVKRYLAQTSAGKRTLRDLGMLPDQVTELALAKARKYLDHHPKHLPYGMGLQAQANRRKRKLKLARRLGK